MKKIYMVKKNPNMPENEDNWIIMNGFEFAMFMKTEEGQRRKNNFAQLDACSEDDDIYIVECGEERAKEWRSEKDAHDYLRECEAESGLETVSFNAVNKDGEEINLEDVFADPESDVVAEVIGKVTHEKLIEALKTLSDSDYDLIYHLYLADERLTAREYAAKMKVCEAAISKKKKRIIKKLKKYFGYDG